MLQRERDFKYVGNYDMFNELLEKIKRVDEIESKLVSIFEGKSWEYIAKALYQILDGTTDGVCRENVEVFRSTVMELQVEKNRLLYSFAGHTIARVDETIADRIWNFLRGNPDSTFNEILDGIDAVGEDAGKFGDVVKDMLNKSIYVEDGRYRLVKRLKENLTSHARRELELAGMFDKEVDGSEACGSWNRLCAEAVMELMEVFAEQGHSGFSASMTQELFSRLARYEKLTELTDNIDEWMDISAAQSGEPGWQSRRSPSCFSEDGGKTYWDIDEDWNKHEDEDGSVWSGGLSKEEWTSRPMHQSKHIEKNKAVEVKEHAAENGLKEFEYLLHHIVNDKGEEEVHHCLVYDHVGNMFEQGHLVVKDGKVTLDGKKVEDGTFHVIKGLESSQEVVWSDDEAEENKIDVKKMKSGMTFKDKSKVW